MKDHKLMYGTYLRAGMLASLVTFIVLFLFVPYAPPAPYELRREIVTMVENISSYIERIEQPPPLDRHRLAVAAESDLIEEAAETIAATEFREDLIRTMPTGPEIEIVPYYRVEVKPQPLVQVTPRYPDLARRAGIEGTSVVKALVDIDGNIIDAQILKPSGNQMLDEEALLAARKWKFSPAKQRDRNVRVYVAIPMEFRLTGGG
ncbi:energy transducer TonB [candidate division WOR-3 bacterium]|nr:energy transducer TonB [candidate division WOR-3 bacterium]